MPSTKTNPNARWTNDSILPVYPHISSYDTWYLHNNTIPFLSSWVCLPCVLQRCLMIFFARQAFPRSNKRTTATVWVPPLGRASCRRRRRTICKRRLFRQRYVRDQEKEVSHIESNCTKMTGSTLTMLVGELSRSGESAMKGWSPLDLPNYRYVSQLEFPRL